MRCLGWFTGVRTASVWNMSVQKRNLPKFCQLFIYRHSSLGQRGSREHRIYTVWWNNEMRDIVGLKASAPFDYLFPLLNRAKKTSVFLVISASVVSARTINPLHRQDVLTNFQIYSFFILTKKKSHWSTLLDKIAKEYTATRFFRYYYE